MGAIVRFTSVTKEDAPREVRTPKKVPKIISEILLYAFISGGIFLLILFVTNFQAYVSLLSYQIGKLTGSELKQTEVLSQVFDPKDGGGSLGRVTSQLSGIHHPPIDLNPLPPDNYLIIPKIGKSVPIVEIPFDNFKQQNWKALDKDIETGLQNGVIHYPGTATPGQKGNVFITGHSSYYVWDKGRYKDVFALLGELAPGDEVHIIFGGHTYHYVVSEKKVVKPTDTEVLDQTSDHRLTLMTCTPVGTNINRLIIVALQK